MVSPARTLSIACAVLTACLVAAAFAAPALSQAESSASKASPAVPAPDSAASAPIQDVKSFGSQEPSAVAIQPRSSPLSPEFHTARDALTPSDPIGRDLNIYDHATPGLSTILHSSKDTEIKGILSFPGSNAGSARPYGQPENGSKSSASGGVILKRTF